MDLPHLQLIDQEFATESQLDARRCSLDELERAGLLSGIKPGQTVLVTAGSRGVGCMREVLGAALTMKSGLDIGKPRLAAAKSQSRGTVIMATVKGARLDIERTWFRRCSEGPGSSCWTSVST